MGKSRSDDLGSILRSKMARGDGVFLTVSLCVMGDVVSSTPGFGGEVKGISVKVCRGVLVPANPPVTRFW